MFECLQVTLPTIKDPPLFSNALPLTLFVVRDQPRIKTHNQSPKNTISKKAYIEIL